MLPFRYLPLRHDDSIRLLSLYPNPDRSSPIECTIQHARLSDPTLRYYAISYAWGTDLEEVSISIHGQQRKHTIRKSCYSVLNRLRRKGALILVWIDAICINQQDRKEASAQVCLMDRIYATAFQVVIYLGESTPGSEILFEELADLDRLLATSRKFDMVPLSITLFKELQELFQRDWFRRVWVLQEAYLNKSTTVMCGSDCVSWRALKDFCWRPYEREHDLSIYPLPHVFYLVGHGPPRLFSPILELWQLLYDTRGFLATDKKDKIFALRSLVTSDKEELDQIIDYRQTYEETFITVGLRFLSSLGLRLLVAARHPHQLQIPSWVPDWSQHLPLNFQFFKFDCYDSLDNVEICGKCQKHRQNNREFALHYTQESSGGSIELRVVGHQYARISYISETFSFANREDAKQKMVEIYGYFENLRRLCKLSPKSCVAKNLSYMGNEIICAMKSIDGPQLHNFLTLDHGIILGHDGDVFDGDVFDGENLHEFSSALEQCKIILTDTGHLGVAPKDVQKTDSVCIFKGSYSPCIIRRKLGTHYWSMISGDCYILDRRYLYDDGNIILFSSDAYLDDVRSQLEEFSIL